MIVVTRYALTPVVAYPLSVRTLSPQVRYDANSEFNEHGHPDGEEILVLEGAWQGGVTVLDSTTLLYCNTSHKH